MKYKISVFILSLLIIITTSYSNGYAKESLKFNLSLKINGILISDNIRSYNIRGINYSPLKDVLSSNSFRFKENTHLKQLTLYSRSKIIKLTHNSNKVELNDSTINLNNKVLLINNITYVPIIEFLNLMEYYVTWKPDIKTISANTLKSNSTLGILNSTSLEELEDKYIISTYVSKINSYKSFQLKDQNKLVVDFPNTLLSNNTRNIYPVNKEIHGIRLGQFTPDTARLVIDFRTLLDYEIHENRGNLKIIIPRTKEISNITYASLNTRQSSSNTIETVTMYNSKNPISLNINKNILNDITYTNKYDRIAFILKNTQFTNGGKNLTNHYSSNYTNNILSLKLPNKYANLEDEVITINDNYIDKMIIKNIDSYVDIKIYTKTKVDFNIITRDPTNDTAITILPPKNSNQKLIIIDAGHGGIEPGAVHKDVFEKDLNLDISLKLNKLLTENGYNTYMIREDDSYVSLYERAYIANKLNASLFLSIHNNAFYSAQKGSETLYYPPNENNINFNSETFAKIIQDNLIKTLQTKDRGIVKRPNLVVLSATTMIAALTEIGFITNDSDRKNLLDNNFRHKVASSLFESVKTAIKRIN